MKPTLAEIDAHVQEIRARAPLMYQMGFHSQVDHHTPDYSLKSCAPSIRYTFPLIPRYSRPPSAEDMTPN